MMAFFGKLGMSFCASVKSCFIVGAVVCVASGSVMNSALGPRSILPSMVGVIWTPSTPSVGSGNGYIMEVMRLE